MKELIDDEEFKASISKKGTGLDFIVWIQMRRHKEQLIPCVEFQNNTSHKIDSAGRISVLISNEPQLLSPNIKLNIPIESYNGLVKWIVLNRKLLIQHWCKEITSWTFFECTKRVK